MNENIIPDGPNSDLRPEKEYKSVNDLFPKLNKVFPQEINTLDIILENRKLKEKNFTLRAAIKDFLINFEKDKDFTYKSEYELKFEQILKETL